MNEQLTISPQGIALLKRSEALRLVAYQDGTGVWTIGWGHVSKSVHKGLRITEAQAEVFLQQDLFGFELAVRHYVTVPITQGQFDALVDFTFNEGAEHLAESTLLRLLNAGNIADAAKEFARWVYAAGEVEPGLQVRRAAETAMFLAA